MDKFIYYFDKWTGWLDFSWLITRTRTKKIDSKNINSKNIAGEIESAHYEVDSIYYEVEPLIDSYHK
jgi:hypothetical protein